MKVRTLRRLKWVSGVVWIWSWYTMYLEIFRWKHVTPTLRFNPGPPLQGMRPRPGLPLIGVYLASALAPLTFLTTVIMDRAHRTDAETAPPNKVSTSRTKRVRDRPRQRRARP